MNSRLKKLQIFVIFPNFKSVEKHENSLMSVDHRTKLVVEFTLFNYI